MAEKRITKMDNFEDLRALVETLEESERKARLIKFISHEEELILNKSKGSKKINAINEELERIVLKELERLGTPTTVTDLLEASEELKSFIVAPATETEKAKKVSNQKLSSILTQLKERGVVVRTTEKKKSYFSLAKIA